MSNHSKVAPKDLRVLHLNKRCVNNVKKMLMFSSKSVVLLRGVGEGGLINYVTSIVEGTHDY